MSVTGASLQPYIGQAMASRAPVLNTPAGSQEAVFRAAGWDLSHPCPRAGKSISNSSARARNRPETR